MSLLLVPLVNAMVIKANTAPDGTWSDLSIGTTPEDYLKAVPAFDPLDMFESENKGLFILPITISYNRSESKGRQSIIQLYKAPIITVCISIPFGPVDQTGVDVAPWPDVSKILNLREELDHYLLTQNWGINIADITAETAQRIPLKKRWFLSVTEIEFGAVSC